MTTRTLKVASGRWDDNVAVIDAEAARDRRTTQRTARCCPPARDAGRRTARRPPASRSACWCRRTARTPMWSAIQAASLPPPRVRTSTGIRGAVTVLDIAALRDPRHDGTTGAIAAIVETGTAGPVGSGADAGWAASAGRLGRGGGGGGWRRRDHGHRARHAQGGARIRLRDAGEEPGARIAASGLRPLPQPNGIACSALGTGWLVRANGGTDDVSIIDLAAALAGDAGAEVARVPVQSGGFGIQVSPDWRWRRWRRGRACGPAPCGNTSQPGGYRGRGRRSRASAWARTIPRRARAPSSPPSRRMGGTWSRPASPAARCRCWRSPRRARWSAWRWPTRPAGRRSRAASRSRRMEAGRRRRQEKRGPRSCGAVDAGSGALRGDVARERGSGTRPICWRSCRRGGEV